MVVPDVDVTHSINIVERILGPKSVLARAGLPVRHHGSSGCSVRTPWLDTLCADFRAARALTACIAPGTKGVDQGVRCECETRLEV